MERISILFVLFFALVLSITGAEHDSGRHHRRHLLAPRSNAKPAPVARPAAPRFALCGNSSLTQGLITRFTEGSAWDQFADNIPDSVTLNQRIEQQVGPVVTKYRLGGFLTININCLFNIDVTVKSVSGLSSINRPKVTVLNGNVSCPDSRLPVVIANTSLDISFDQLTVAVSGTVSTGDCSEDTTALVNGLSIPLEGSLVATKPTVTVVGPFLANLTNPQELCVKALDISSATLNIGELDWVPTDSSGGITSGLINSFVGQFNDPNSGYLDAVNEQLAGILRDILGDLGGCVEFPTQQFLKLIVGCNDCLTHLVLGVSFQTWVCVDEFWLREWLPQLYKYQYMMSLEERESTEDTGSTLVMAGLGMDDLLKRTSVMLEWPAMVCHCLVISK